ncbi:MAG: pyridoxamine 5'-phosphate oxidase family protein [Acidimicrobiia bacterium]
MAQKQLQELSVEECLQLLTQARVGRLAYLDEMGPVAVPVNFATVDRDIYFRVEDGVKRAAIGQPCLAFEVDHIDDDQHAGWSVIARGAGREVPPDDLPALLKRMHGSFPAPWALGIHNVWLQLSPHTITGRRLGQERSAPTF